MQLKSLNDAVLYSETAMTECELFAIANGQAAVFTAPSHLRETPNEDSLALLPYDNKSCVLVIADGVGGIPGGSMASALAIGAVRAAVATAAKEGQDLRDAILNGIENANRAVLTQGGGSATTLAVVEIQKSVARPYHVGDSEIIITGQRGKLKLQTVPHSPVGYGVEAGVIDPHEAIHHEDRHLVSNVIGIDDMRIEIGAPIKLGKYDTLFLATDGMSDNLHVHEMVEIMRKGALDKAAAKMISAVEQRMHDPEEEHPSKADDHSFILFRLK